MDINDWVLLMAMFQVYEDHIEDWTSRQKAKELKRKFTENIYKIVQEENNA